MGLISFLREKFKKKDSTTEKYSQGMEKSRKNFSSKLKNLSTRYKTVNQDYFDELEQILIESDVGINFTLNIIEEVLNRSETENIKDPEKINEILVDRMFVGYASKGDIQNEIRFEEGKPTVLLVVGVNGVGKTTTIAKLAYRYINKGKKVMLVAADTFRAGAIEQLSVWADRLGIDIVTGNPEADPASVAYDGVKKGKQNNCDLIIVDTAGIRNTDDTVEKIGVERALNEAKDADLIIYVVDSSVPLDSSDEQIINEIRDRKAIVLMNKSDLEAVLSLEELKEITGHTVLSISAKDQTGIDVLEPMMPCQKF